MSSSQYYVQSMMTPGLPVAPSQAPKAQLDPGSYEYQNMMSQQSIAMGQEAAQTNAAKLGLQGTQAQAAAQVSAAQAAAEAQKYGANQQLAGTQAQLAYKQGIFNTFYPNLLNQFNTISSTGTGSDGPGSVAPQQGYVTSIDKLGSPGSSGSYGYSAGNDTAYKTSATDQAATDQLLARINSPTPTAAAPPSIGPAPKIGAYTQPKFEQASLIDPQSMPVISQGLLSQQINNALGSNAQQSATAIRQAGQGLGGRGLGANSPLAQGMQNQIRASEIGANSQASLAAQNNAAQQNAAYAQAMNQALIGQAAQVYGSQTQGALGAYESQNTTGAADYSAQLQALMSGYGSQVGAQSSMYNAGQQAAASGYGSQLGLQGQLGAADLQRRAALGAADLQRQATLGASQNASNANIYGTNTGYQQAINVANIQSQASRQNALLQSLASFANG